MELATTWGFSSAGRAPALQAGGQRFDPANLHHTKKVTVTPKNKIKVCFDFERKNKRSVVSFGDSRSEQHAVHSDAGQ